MTEAAAAEKGQAMSEMLDAARERLARNALAGWSEHDLEELARLLRRFSDNLLHGPADPRGNLAGGNQDLHQPLRPLATQQRR